MTKVTKFTMTALLGIGLASLVSSCQKGPAEKLGEKIDNGVQNTKDAARDLKEDLSKHQ